MGLLRYSDEDNALLAEMRKYMSEWWPVDRQIQGLIEQNDYQDHIPLEWEHKIWRQLAQRGWLGLGIPVSYGGNGGTDLQRYLFVNEMAYFGAPVPRTALQVVAPALLAFGSETIKHRYLPRIARGEINFCLGYSEPASGTDLASLKTRATRVDGGYVINGQKIFTTRAHRCDYVYLAARTSNEGLKHAGISLFVIDLRAKGVAIEPLPTMHGRTNLTFYDDVFVPADDLVGEENKGWSYLTLSLGLERIGFFLFGHLSRLHEVIVDLSRRPRPDGRIPMDSPVVRDELARLHVDLMLVEALVDGTLALTIEGGDLPSSAAAQIKAFITEHKQRLIEFGLEMLGPYGQLTAEPLGGQVPAGLLEEMWRDAILHTFGGGTNEVQRDIIATAALGLPRSR
jgi:3-oxocholest-4-en-26-oyl-CoA dehydrogenase alpha subunit